MSDPTELIKRLDSFTMPTNEMSRARYDAVDMLSALAAERDSAIAERDKERNSYRCYACKQVFEEDHGHGLAAAHFGRAALSMRTKCQDFLDRTSAGGPHDPFLNRLFEQVDGLQAELEETKQKYFVQGFTRGRKAGDALWKEGAEAMREKCEQACEKDRKDWIEHGCPEQALGAVSCRQAIRALPIPTREGADV